MAITIPFVDNIINKVLQNNKKIDEEEKLSMVKPSERILLLPHCLRNPDLCKAKNKHDGLQCAECDPGCQINRLRKIALLFGYKGVCIAPGGSMALKYVKDNNPKGIVAVACQKELIEGIDSVKELLGDSTVIPPIIIIPLVKDGCINTEVDIQQAISKISSGCFAK